MNAPDRDERWHLSCNACGHWKAAAFTKDEVADWLRVHSAARIVPDAHGMDRESTCPHPCGTPFKGRAIDGKRT